MVNLLMRLGHPRSDNTSGFLSAGESLWKGNQVAVFTREKLPHEEPRGWDIPFATKESVYVNPATRLPVAMRVWGKVPGARNWELISQQELDYKRIDSARFDPKPLLSGADQIRRAVGDRMVVVKKSAPLHYLTPSSSQPSQSKP
jgi:hypothetical protein